MNRELIAKARETSSVEELIELAGENGIEMSEEAAKELFDRLHSADELSDVELDKIAAGLTYPVRSGHSSFMDYLNKDSVAKAREANIPEELIELVRKNGAELTGELSDDQMDSVAGGSYGNITLDLMAERIRLESIIPPLSQEEIKAALLEKLNQLAGEG